MVSCGHDNLGMITRLLHTVGIFFSMFFSDMRYKPAHVNEINAKLKKIYSSPQILQTLWPGVCSGTTLDHIVTYIDGQGT